MTRVPFTKPSLSIDDQIGYLARFGMDIDADDWTRRQLQQKSYYRLSAYWLPFEVPKTDQTPTHRFRPGTCFRKVVEIYEFDRILRQRVAQAIEIVEVALRASWAHTLAMKGDPFTYLEPALYKSGRGFNYAQSKQRLLDEFERSKETFAEHYRRKYDRREPPVWMASETLSLGTLSRWYGGLKQRALRTAIAEPFGLYDPVFATMVHHLTVAKNTCAHYSRLWNRGVPTVELPEPDKVPDLAASFSAPRSTTYNTLTLLTFLLAKLNELHDWRDQVIAHLDTLPHGSLSQMGFPDDWQTRPLWNRRAAP